MTTSLAHRFRSVQIRTTAIAMITVVVVLLAGAAGVAGLFERQQLRQVDANLDRGRDFVRDSLRTGRGIPDVSTPSDLAQLIDKDGKVLFATPRLRGQRAAWTPAAGDPARHRTVSIPGVGRARVTATPIGNGWLVLLSSLSTIEEARSSLRTALAVAVPLVAVALAVVVWLVVGRTLRPVRASIEREERLVADVTHELRSPLAGVRALLETEGRQSEEIALNRLDALAALDRLDALTDGLLAIARQDGGRAVDVAPLLDLDDVVIRAVEHAPRRDGVTVDVSGVIAGQVRGYESDLERVAANLLSNAVRHAASTVRVSVREAGDRVELRVADDGGGIAAGDRQRIFDRFTRLDEARSRDAGGAGLGLSIVRAVVEAHGGTVEADDGAGGGAEFVVSLPRGDA